MSTSEAIQKALSDAQRYLGELPAPPNEANTCDWVIRPLLLALGYQNHEIHAQSGDVANKFPDYTILPSSDHTWYLEAKAWSVGLDSMHVDQSINYAHSNGRRWVVLTNGREWRLYDDTIQGVSADRQVATARLEDSAGMERFLKAISRTSIQAKEVESYASERRVRDYISRAIADPSSQLIQAILKVVRQQVGNGPVTASAIVDILNARQSAVATEPTAAANPPRVSAEPTFGSKQHARIGPLYLNAKGLRAEGFFENRMLTVLKGSMVCKFPTISHGPKHKVIIARAITAGEIIDRGEHYELAVDKVFKSPSGASDFVLGAASNGWGVWKDASGVMLDTLYKRGEAEKWREGMPWKKER